MPTVETLVEQQCYLIRNALSPKEQIDLFQDVLNQSQETDNSPKRCMNPSPKTIIFDGNRSTIHYELLHNDRDDRRDDNGMDVFNKMIQTVNKCLFRDGGNNNNNDVMELQHNHFPTFNHLSVGVIRYPVPDGNFPEHCDHCKNSWVYLLSLGCTATFVVYNKETMDEKLSFGMQSGDVLVFDASTEASIIHGVKNIQPNTCPRELLDMLVDDDTTSSSLLLQNHRFGVQCRVRYRKKGEKEG